MRFTIDRKTWLRGEGCDASFLLRSDGKKCCMGFYGLALGLTEVQLLSQRSPRGVAQWPKDWTKGRLADLMRVFELNDAELGEPGIGSEEERERRIRSLFGKHGVEVEFVGEP